MERDRKKGQNGKDGDRRPMTISYKEWERRYDKIFNNNKQKEDKDE